MYKTSKTLLFSLVAFFINGCSSVVSKTLSPPSDTKWVYVEIKNPSPYTRPFPLEVRYISHKCLKKRVSGFDGSMIVEPSYNVIKIPLQQQNGDLWQGQVEINGGGSCQWTLNVLTLGIEYIEATHLGKDLVPGTAVGATIAFDNNAASNGLPEIIEGNKLDYSPKYYPFIKKWKGNKNQSMKDRLYLFGDGNAFWNVRINVNNDYDTMIKYHPLIDESKKVEMVFPYKKKEGAKYLFFYPNGDEISSTDIKPDFHKVESM